MDNETYAAKPDLVAEAQQNAQAARRCADDLRVDAWEARERAAALRERARYLRLWRQSMPSSWPVDADTLDE